MHNGQSSRIQPRTPHPHRRGTVLLVAMVALLLISLIGTSVLKVAAAQRRQVRFERWRVQAALLAESAAERAAARLGKDAAYAGETWEPPPAEIGGTEPARVQIVVEPAAEGARERTLRIHAEYPAGNLRGARHRQSWTWTPP